MRMAGSGRLALQELAFYMRNCARGPFAKRLEAKLLARLDRLKGFADGLDGDDEDDDDTAARFGDIALRRQLMRELRAVLNRFAGISLDRGLLTRNALFAQEEFGLDAIEFEILLLLLRNERNIDLKNLATDVESKTDTDSELIAALIGRDPRLIDQRLKRDARLAACGLVRIDPGSRGIGPCSYVRVSPPLRRVMDRSFRSRSSWVAALAGDMRRPELAWEDFAHLGEAAALARDVLSGAVCAKAKGVNVLLHGPVGTGKTEFCKVLAAEAGLLLWAVAEEDDEQGEPDRRERLASLALLQRLLRARTNALILFDEAEDLLEQPGMLFGARLGERNGSKVHINRFLEANPVPVIWTCNHAAGIDPAVLRRMTLAIAVKTPGESVRSRIWRRALSLASVKVEDAAVTRLAQKYEAPAAVAANAARAAALAKGGEKAIERALDGVLPLLDLAPQPERQSDLVFDPRFVNCAEDVGAIADRLARAGAPANWSLCLSGPPGTGKSEYARYIARRMGIETIQRRASDLLSMWLGGSEKQIAAAFAEARDRYAMLIVDEADSLLADRRGAVRSWEVTQVNEMLTWMEHHPFPFVCTTNLAERLDQASLRRFVFKLRFEPLARVQARDLFAQTFGFPAPSELPDALTPGDFATVKRRAALIGKPDPAELAVWLAEEIEARGVPVRRIGFAA